MDHNLSSLQSETLYQSACANRHENNVSSSDNYLLYSRSKCPIVYDLTTKKIATFLQGHTDEVNGQSFIITIHQDHGAKAYHIISSSYDKTAIIWAIKKDAEHKNRIKSYILYKLTSPDSSVFTSRCSICQENNEFISITTTLNGSIYLWRNEKLVETLTKKYYCFDSKIHTIKVEGETLCFLFLAGSDNKLHVFQLSESNLFPIFDLGGYNDWVKCLDILIISSRNNEFLVASASQDSFIRIWHMKLIDHEFDSRQVRTTVSDYLQTSAANKSFRLTSTLETVLSSHGSIVHGLCWFKRQPEPILQLISCSEDKTIIVWKSSIAKISEDQTQQLNRYDQYPASGEIWRELYKVGETGEANLPFLGVCLSEDERTFYSHSLRGAIHSWTLDEGGNCIPSETITGHFDSITDLSWERSGAYLLSCSLDKTCRLHGVSTKTNRWHEIARPQVHGHEINCLASLDFARFATGAEEKTIRVFEATKFSLRSFMALTDRCLPEEVTSNIENFPAQAQLPALGLSIRASRGIKDKSDQANKEAKSESSDQTWYGISKLIEELTHTDHLNDLPIEEILLQSTLWWEVNKLFGHGNELHAISASHSGSHIASASKANRKDLASVFIWECSKFRKAASIEHHNLTVTRLKFSPDDKYLLSVSRDRTWCISVRTGKQRPAYEKLFGTNKSNAIHERIIWDCCWTFDSKYFMTVSRDKKAILWSTDEIHAKVSSSGDQPVDVQCASSKLLHCSIQAVDSTDRPLEGSSLSYLFAFGFEDGSLELFRISLQLENYHWELLQSFQEFHQLSIRRLAFKPSLNQDTEVEKSIAHLASAGDDCVLKLTKFFFETNKDQL